jgi:hypothetical protein
MSFGLRLLRKVHRVTQRVLFNGRLQRRLRAMKIKVMVLSGVRDDSDEKIRIKHANYLKIYYASEFMSPLKIYESQQCIN